MTQLDQVTQQNSATSEEAAAASEELSAQAQNMQGLVARFRISSNGNGRSQTPAARKSPERRALPESHEQHHVPAEAAVAEKDLAEF